MIKRGFKGGIVPVKVDDCVVFAVSVGDEALLHEHAHLGAVALPHVEHLRYSIICPLGYSTVIFWLRMEW